MSTPEPPPIPKRQPASRKANRRLSIFFATVAGVFVAGVVMLRIFGLVQPFSIPTSSMAPAVSPGDHIMMEGITFLSRNPRKGDIVVFKSDGISSLIQGATYVSRIAGEPGDHLRIAEEKLYVNEKHLPLKNKSGDIRYVNIRDSRYLASTGEMLTIHEGQYFVLARNSTNSLH